MKVGDKFRIKKELDIEKIMNECKEIRNYTKEQYEIVKKLYEDKETIHEITFIAENGVKGVILALELDVLVETVVNGNSWYLETNEIELIEIREQEALEGHLRIIKDIQ